MIPFFNGKLKYLCVKKEVSNIKKQLKLSNSYYYTFLLCTSFTKIRWTTFSSTVLHCSNYLILLYHIFCISPVNQDISSNVLVVIIHLNKIWCLTNLSYVLIISFHAATCHIFSRLKEITGKYMYQIYFFSTFNLIFMPYKYCFSLYHVMVCFPLYLAMAYYDQIFYFQLHHVMVYFFFTYCYSIEWKTNFYSSFFHSFYSIFNLLQPHDHHYPFLHQHQQLHLYLHQYQQDQIYHVTISINTGLFTDIYSTINKKFHYFV